MRRDLYIRPAFFGAIGGFLLCALLVAAAYGGYQYQQQRSAVGSLPAEAIAL